MTAVPNFDNAFRHQLASLMAWRRDVRTFTGASIDPAAWEAILGSLETAPSVGLSQPWRIVRVLTSQARERVRRNFCDANAEALSAQDPDRADTYAKLKLQGIDTAPEQLAVFCDPEPLQGHGLGRRTIPQTVHDSAVCAIMQVWLTARAHGVGLGWVSILDPARLAMDLNVPANWSHVAYLCLGYPAEEQSVPELERQLWETRRPQAAAILNR